MAWPESALPDAPPTELDKLKVAMAVQVARRIVDADGILDVSEIELLSRAFPDRWLQRCGFLDADGQLDPAIEAWFERAEKELCHRLELRAKLELITLFHGACVADGELHPTELDILAETARKLHIPLHRYRQHLAGLRGPGSVPPIQDPPPER